MDGSGRFISAWALKTPHRTRFISNEVQPETLKNILEEGRIAAEAGRSIADNPYFRDMNNKRLDAWLEGVQIYLKAGAMTPLSFSFFDRIENSALSGRLINILIRNDVLSLSQLQRMTDQDILLLKNVGPDYLAEIRRHPK